MAELMVELSALGLVLIQRRRRRKKGEKPHQVGEVVNSGGTGSLTECV